jgi:hypothetical protein
MEDRAAKWRGGESDFAQAELLVATAAIVATDLARKLK